MAVPTVITDLNISAASNSPAGSDTIGSTLDDFLRANSAFIKQLFDICTVYSATVGGTANAITLSPAIALTTYKTGQRIAFKATGSSSGVVTINVSALGAKKAFSTDGTTQLTTGDITSGKYYSLIYDSSLDAAAGGFMLDGSGNFLTSAAAASTYAPLASPTFTGTPSLPTGTTGVTQSAADSSTKLATTAFAKTVMTKQTFTSGSGTYTTPSSVLYLKVRMVGGGGGGAGSGSAPSAATDGGDSTFGTLTAAKGVKGVVGAAGGAGGAGTNGDLNLTGGAGGAATSTVVSMMGGDGGESAFGGNGRAGAATNGTANAGTAAVTNSGSGGGGASSSSSNGNSGSGGGAGAYVEKLITSPSATYSYGVGAAGSGGGAGGSGGAAGGNGGSGLIIVEEYYIG